MSARARPLRRALLALCLSAMTVPAAASERKSAESVVQIRCTLDSGEMKATGFVWPKPGQIVTALHAVAGCAEIVVFSELKPAETIATDLLSVDLEADLALLQLQDDMGLPPVPYAQTAPDTRGNFVAWGYPHAAEEMIDLRVQFGGGLKGGVTTIGSAFASRELNELFRTQSYPGRDTKILRVTTTIQPGHSGAPIFDENGGVVAIADGGLLGGWRTINWSIPAHIYLKDLPFSTDPIPTEASSWAGLYSAAMPAARNAPVAKPAHGMATDEGAWPEEEWSDETWADDDDGFGESTLGPDSDLTLVRRITLGQALEYIAYIDEGAPILAEVEAALWDYALLDEVTFDVYEDAVTGATVAVPSWLALDWDNDEGMAWVYNDTDTLEMTISVVPGDGFEDALDVLHEHVLWLDEWAQWMHGRPADYAFEIYDEEAPYAAHEGFYFGQDAETGREGQMLMSLAVSGDIFLGSTVFMRPHESGEPTEDDFFEALMMQISAMFLTDFAVF